MLTETQKEQLGQSRYFFGGWYTVITLSHISTNQDFLFLHALLSYAYCNLIVFFFIFQFLRLYRVYTIRNTDYIRK